MLSDLSAGYRTVSQDGSAAVANVTFTVPINELTAEVKTEIEDLVADADVEGVESTRRRRSPRRVPSILGAGEIAGVVIAAIALFVVLGTMLGAALPLAPRCSAWAWRRWRRCRSPGWWSSSPSRPCSA